MKHLENKSEDVVKTDWKQHITEDLQEGAGNNF